MKAVLPALLALSVASAHAGSYTVSQGFDVGGDLATGTFDNIFLPTFNPAKGTLESVDLRIISDLTWSQSFFEPVDPSKPWVLGSSAEFTALTTNSLVGSGDVSPTVFTREVGFLPTFPIFHFALRFADDPSFYLDPFNPEGLTMTAPAGAFCVRNCQTPFGVDDSFGTLNGKIRTTFNYRPSTIPEPASLVLLAIGLIGAVGVRRSARPRSS